MTPNFPPFRLYFFLYYVMIVDQTSILLSKWGQCLAWTTLPHFSEDLWHLLVYPELHLQCHLSFHTVAHCPERTCSSSLAADPHIFMFLRSVPRPLHPPHGISALLILHCHRQHSAVISMSFLCHLMPFFLVTQGKQEAMTLLNQSGQAFWVSCFRKLIQEAEAVRRLKAGCPIVAYVTNTSIITENLISSLLSALWILLCWLLAQGSWPS